MSSVYKNLFYTIASNVVSFVCSALITLIIPKCLGLEDYGYFQVYLFYTTYIGFFHFGWADGVLLRYGGAYYEKLDKAKMSAQFWLYSGLELVLGLLVIIVGLFSGSDAGKGIVIAMTGICILLMLPRTLLQYILQATNRIKEYAVLTVIERVIYVAITIVVLLLGTKSFIPILIADLLGKLVAFVYSIVKCFDIIKTKPEEIKEALVETKKNVRVGIKLMFANVASLLVIGLVRLAIESEWDVATFGKVSLTLSVCNMLLVFIHAIASVLFPMLRRTDEGRRAEIYVMMRTCLMTLLFGMLIFYYPLKLIMSYWLPHYADSLNYMALLFPMCVYESKITMLIETYMKTLRMEKKILVVNVLTMLLSVILTVITVFTLHNLDLAIGSIVVLLAFRCVIAELLLEKKLQVKVKMDIVQELVLTAIFIFSSWTIGGLVGLSIYTIIYIVYLVIHAKDIKDLAFKFLGTIKEK